MAGQTRLAQALFKKRVGLHLTTRQAAERCGVVLTTYWRAERGKTPDIVNGMRLAKWLEQSLEELFP